MIYPVGIDWKDVGKMMRHNLDTIQKYLDRIQQYSGHTLCAAFDKNEIVVFDADYNVPLIRSPVSPKMEAVISQLRDLQTYWYYENNCENLRSSESKLRYAQLKKYFYGTFRKKREYSQIGSSVCHYAACNIVGY